MMQPNLQLSKMQLLDRTLLLLGAPCKSISQSVVNKVKRIISEDFMRNRGADVESSIRIYAAIQPLVTEDAKGIVVLKS
jgi:hypothetical protein